MKSVTMKGVAMKGITMKGITMKGITIGHHEGDHSGRHECRELWRAAIGRVAN